MIKILAATWVNGIVLLQEQAIIVQKPAGAGGSGIKQQSCLIFYLVYLLYNKMCAETPDHQ